MNTLIVGGVIALLALFFARKTIVVVRQAQTMVIERLGKYSRTLSSGINIIMPVFDQPRAIDWHSVISLPSGETITRRYRSSTIAMGTMYAPISI